jgi:fatty-acyl-CoA synthase
MTCMIRGAAMVIPAESFDPQSALVAVEKERCTALYGVPTMFNAELNLPNFDEYDLTTLRTGIMAGSPCPIELMKQVTQHMHLTELTIAYGLTEFSPVITQTETTDPIDVRVGTVGATLPGVEVRIVDPETLEDSPEGKPGELWARGHGVMLGYYKDPHATELTITPEGWLRTGDLATRTPAGHYRITGRIKDMIIRGGENIYPREIEEFLLTHPKIYDAQVVGLPDIHYGEQVSAWIIPRDPSLTADEIKAFCKGNIAHYKIPHYIAFVEEFPLTVSNKIQKFKLREMGIEKYALDSAARTETA